MRRLLTIPAVLLLVAGADSFAQTGTFIDRDAPGDVRIVSYNINWDSIFPDDDPNNHGWRDFNMVEEFRRVVVALDPDILCVQEINDSPPRDPNDVADILDEVLPLDGWELWRAHQGSDNVIVSRWDLSMLRTDTIPTTYRGQAMALVDLPDVLYSYDLYVMNAHFKAGGGQDNIDRRQKHADAIIHWIGDIKTPGDYIDLPAGTPIVTLGDLNVYDTDPHYHLTTLITGNIVFEDIYGPDVVPDWDDTDMTDAVPWHNGTGGPDFYTWRSDGSSYNPGALDRFVFTDSAVASLGNNFVLNTVTMTQEDRDAAGLEVADVVLDLPGGYYDHLPIVVDVRLPSAVEPDGDVSLDGHADGEDISWFVNQAMAGIMGDPLRIAHADYDANGVIEFVDLPDFLDDLLGS